LRNGWSVAPDTLEEGERDSHLGRNHKYGPAHVAAPES
jgi:hypothetical protein